MAVQLGLKNKQIEQDRIIRKLAAKYGKDERVIRMAVYSPFKFFRSVMADPLDERPVRIRYFGVFTLRHKDAKKNMYKRRVDTMKKHIGRMIVILASMGYFIKDESSVNRILDEALEQRDYEKIEQFWLEYGTSKRKVK